MMRSRNLTSNTLTTLSQLKVNAKGHPTVGMLTLRRQIHVNPYLTYCTTLYDTAKILSQMYEFEGLHFKSWRKEIYEKLFDFINVDMNPSPEDIDNMLLVCHVLFKNKKYYEYQKFVMNCPTKFIVKYANNSEHTPALLYNLEKIGLTSIRFYLTQHIDSNKLSIWKKQK